MILDSFITNLIILDAITILDYPYSESMVDHTLRRDCLEMEQYNVILVNNDVYKKAMGLENK
jgi:hypothetical protein